MRWRRWSPAVVPPVQPGPSPPSVETRRPASASYRPARCLPRDVYLLGFLVLRVSLLRPVLAVSLLLLGCTDQSSGTFEAASKVILIIGDGMDDQQVTMARNYLVGSRGRLMLDQLPFRGALQVQSVAENDPSRPEYVSDSASTATSLATGELTSSGRIATRAETGENIITIMELAHSAGLDTGIVTTSSLTDAKPASFVAHVSQRLYEGPTATIQSAPPDGAPVDCSREETANGGLGSIAEQIAGSNVRLLLGGGSQHFEQLIKPGFPICLPQMAPLYTREPPSARNPVRRTIVQLQRPSPQPTLTWNRPEPLLSGHFSDTAPHLCPFFASLRCTRPRVSLPAPAAPRSSAASRRRAAGSDDLPPAGASSIWRASPAGPQFSPAAAGDSSATSA